MAGNNAFLRSIQKRCNSNSTRQRVWKCTSPKPAPSRFGTKHFKKDSCEVLESNETITAGISLQQMGQIYFNQGHYAQALDFYLHAEKLFTQQPMFTFIGYS
jgi:hypothetical protein